VPLLGPTLLPTFPDPVPTTGPFQIAVLNYGNDAASRRAWAAAHGCGGLGSDIRGVSSPGIRILNKPTGDDVATFKLEVTDYFTADGRQQTFRHWSVTGIKKADLENMIPIGASRSEGDVAAPITGATENQLPGPAGNIQGWISACPPPGTGEHRYEFVLTAVNAAGNDLAVAKTNVFLSFNDRKMMIEVEDYANNPASRKAWAAAHGCGGADAVIRGVRSPGIKINSKPVTAGAGVASYTLKVTDFFTVEGEASTFEHWDVTGIRPADLTNEIPKGASGSEGAAAAPIAGATERALNGITGWVSPCPPRGTGEHRYQFTFTALNAAGAEVDKAQYNVFLRYEDRLP